MDRPRRQNSGVPPKRYGFEGDERLQANNDLQDPPNDERIPGDDRMSAAVRFALNNLYGEDRTSSGDDQQSAAGRYALENLFAEDRTVSDDDHQSAAATVLHKTVRASSGDDKQSAAANVHNANSLMSHTHRQVDLETERLRLQEEELQMKIDFIKKQKKQKEMRERIERLTKELSDLEVNPGTKVPVETPLEDLVQQRTANWVKYVQEPRADYQDDKSQHSQQQDFYSCERSEAARTTASARASDYPVDDDRKTVPKDNWMEKFVVRQAVKLELPIFDGKPEDWLLFLTQFRESTKHCSYTEYENMARLQKALKGRAREAVKALMLSPSGVEDVIKELEMLFGRPEQIIRSLLSKVREIPAPKDGEQFIEFGAAVRNVVSTMKHLKCGNHLNNPVLLEELMVKIPPWAKMSWGEVVAGRKGIVNLQDFADWTWKSGEILSYTTVSSTSTAKGVKNRVLTVTEEREKKPRSTTCKVCDSISHKTESCRKFYALTPQRRIELVKSKKMCWSCLKDNHASDACFRNKVCGVDGCSQKHHKLLHIKPRGDVPTPQNTEDSGQVATNIAGNKVLMKIIPVTLTGPKGSIETYAFLDDGSTITMVDEEIARGLGLEGSLKPLSVRWTGNMTQRHEDSRVVSVRIKGVHNSAQEFELKNVRTIQDLALPIQSVDVAELSRKWDHIDVSKVRPLHNAQPKILIGLDNASLVTVRGFSCGPYNAPFMAKTKLGWCLYGQMPMNCLSGQALNYHITQVDEELHELVKKSFSTEDFGVKPPSTSLRSREDMKSLQIMEETTKRVPGRWETGLLWKEENQYHIDSLGTALKRFFSLEKRLQKDPELAMKYRDKVHEYLEKGYLVELESNDENLPMEKCWYLPHFPVVNPNKPGKLRLVFDAAATSQGVSLNDQLMTGPDFMNSLPEILIKFRQRRIAFTGDIKEMFHQVNIREEDTNFQRFLWRDSENEKIRALKLVVMSFGAVCSPSLAAYVKDRNAREFLEQFPSAVDAIIHRHYVDDYVDCCDTEEEAIQRAKDVTFIHKEGGFEIRNWLSNSPKFLQEISPQSVEQKSLDLNSSTDRVLGLYYISRSDILTFQVNLHKISPEILQGEKMPTKRGMLQVVMSVYDPLGYLGPYLVRAKNMIQDVWRQKISWDDEIKEDLHPRWLEWIAALPQISDVQIPRCYSKFIPDAISVEMHTFCDASQKAFAAVSYIRVQHPDGVDVAFVCARTRVAPLKPMSTPRLELQGALLASRLADVVTKTLEVKVNKRYFWCDSKVVLSWLMAGDKRLKQFVAHRVGEIRELTDPSEWRWVPSALNVADDATRPEGILDLTSNSRWLTGPNFLKFEKQFWPENSIPEITDVSTDELEEMCCFTCEEFQEFPNPDDYSSWTKLRCHTAWILRYFRRLRRDNSEIAPHVTVSELRDAEIHLIKNAQKACFWKDLQDLQKHGEVSNTSRLRSLTPQIDEKGVMRVGGRLQGATCFPVNTRHPIILDSHHTLAKLILNEYHKLGLHQGKERLINEVRQKYWILGIRTAAQRAFRECQECKVRKASPIEPLMGQIPECRFQYGGAPFSHCGLDYFGPLEIKVGRHHEKRYGVLFICLTTRAIHLELAESLTTRSAMLAIRRFMARRGHPVAFYSDNGTNLRGAFKEIRRAVMEGISVDEIKQNLAVKGVDWFFNPPSSPHMGGGWERLVRSVKSSLLVTLKEKYPSEETLCTLLIEAENIVNSRPLTTVSVDKDDPEALTPNHFILGRSSASQPWGTFTDDDLNRGWRSSQRLADEFWRRWLKEYLPTLTQRHKWNRRTPNLQEGDIVIIADGNEKRNTWPLGRIVKTFPGRDGIVRVVDVETSKGIYRRPTHKICVLEKKL